MNINGRHNLYSKWKIIVAAGTLQKRRQPSSKYILYEIWDYPVNTIWMHGNWVKSVGPAKSLGKVPMLWLTLLFRIFSSILCTRTIGIRCRAKGERITYYYYIIWQMDRNRLFIFCACRRMCRGHSWQDAMTGARGFGIIKSFTGGDDQNICLAGK